MTEVRCKGEIWKFFDKGFWSAFTKTLSNLGEYFSYSFSGGDKITPSKTCEDIAKKLKTGTKVKSYI